VVANEVDRVIAVAIFDDQQLVVAALRSWIERDSGGRIHVVTTGTTPAEIDDLVTRVETGAGGPHVDVILLDLAFRGTVVMDRVATLSEAGFRVVVLSEHGAAALVKAALDAGACAFLTKYEVPEECLDAIVTVADDRPYVTRSLAGGILADPRLSGRERQAMLLWFQGMDMEAVARRMPKEDGSGETVTKSTVRQYLNRARVKYAKVHRPAPSQFALLARAIEDGLIRPEEIGLYESIARHGGDAFA
jgi:DNA-binding NarL/FixJ family response regulator